MTFMSKSSKSMLKSSSGSREYGQNISICKFGGYPCIKHQDEINVLCFYLATRLYDIAEN